MKSEVLIRINIKGWGAGYYRSVEVEDFDINNPAKVNEATSKALGKHLEIYPCDMLASLETTVRKVSTITFEFKP